MRLYIYEETTSTNDLAQSAVFRHSDTIWAYEQSRGRGRRGNGWIARKGENATFTVVLEPQGIGAKEQYLISQITALAISDVLRGYGLDPRVKWTNDIYIGDKKICGVLIENSLKGLCVERSVVGIGINVNQREFDISLPNPTSLALELGCNISVERVITDVRDALLRWYEQLDRAPQEYNRRLYRLGEEHTYQLADGQLFRATIEGVSQMGELLLREADGQLSGYHFREVEFVIESRKR